MSKTDKKCTHCGEPIVKHGNSQIVNHTNIAQPDRVYFFCNKSCKMIWLAERQKNSKDKGFVCKYCGKVYDKKQGAAVHETWCDKNPNSRSHATIQNAEVLEVKNKTFTIEDVRDIDRVFGLTDEQIAKFVRRGGLK